jgi:NAD(P)-dependent dehydrogenase (short-subunit alcohol dehydrogenase family)
VSRIDHARARSPIVPEPSDYYRDAVAVVTGAACGIGAALAELLLLYGAGGVVIADVDAAALERQSVRLTDGYAGKVLGVGCDVTDEEAVKTMIQQAHAFADGRIDVLINNAGAGFSGRFDEHANDDWEQAFPLNFYGPLYGIRAVLPIMRAQGRGHIVNIISGIAFSPMAYQTRYAATKAALNGLTLALRYELWDENIRVSSATPGTAATAIWEQGDGQPPADAQTPEQSARTILAGVAENQRLVLSDAADVSGAKTCFAPEAAAGVDEYLLEIARKRRQGHWVV